MRAGEPWGNSGYENTGYWPPASWGAYWTIITKAQAVALSHTMWLDMESRCMTVGGWWIDTHSFLLTAFHVPACMLSAKFSNCKQSRRGPCPHGDHRPMRKTGPEQMNTFIYTTKSWYVYNCVWKKRGGCLTENDWVSDFGGRSTKASGRKGHLCWDVPSARLKKRKSIWSSGSSGKGPEAAKSLVYSRVFRQTNQWQVTKSGGIWRNEGPGRAL